MHIFRSNDEGRCIFYVRMSDAAAGRANVVARRSRMIAHVACVAPIGSAQKCQMRSLAAITAQFLVGAIPALTSPLNAGAEIER